MIKLLIFDLDDTLYNEKEYVASGFRAVAEFVFLKKELNKDEVFNFLMDSFKSNGRGRNFNELIEKFNLSDMTPELLVGVYREHVPEVALYPGVKELLNNLKNNYVLVLLTNGWVDVQKMKIKALEAENYFDKIFFAQEDGLEFRKPNPKYFLKILSHYRIAPNEALMIGDDHESDIRGAKEVDINTFLVEKPDDLHRLEEYLKKINLFK